MRWVEIKFEDKVRDTPQDWTEADDMKRMTIATPTSGWKTPTAASILQSGQFLPKTDSRSALHAPQIKPRSWRTRTPGVAQIHPVAVWATHWCLLGSVFFRTILSHCRHVASRRSPRAPSISTGTVHISV